MAARPVLKKEYKAFKRDVARELKDLKPRITIFGSYRTKKKRPRDIDVQIDVGRLSDKEFKTIRNKIGRISRYYKHVDPVLYSWGTKRTPRKRKNQTRWKGGWQTYAKI